MDRPLDSDALGRKGEKRFEELCVDANLIPNSAGYDRKGWDVIVEWREEASNRSHDTRPTPPSCHVQVKTVWMETPSVTLRLSSVGFLAKELKPAFIVVLRVDNDLAFREAYIAHIEGALLGRILEALRKASVDQIPPNQTEISLALKKWFKPVEPAGMTIRRRLEAAIGPSMEAYVATKQSALRDLGYDEARVVIHGTIIAPDEDAVLDGLLGLRSLDLTNATAIETRFGITLPLEDFSSEGTMEFAADPIDTCRILARPPHRASPYVFPGSMTLARLNPKRGRMLLRLEHFVLTIDGRRLSGTSNVEFEMGLVVDGGLPDKLLPVTTWVEIYGFLAAICGDTPLRFEIHPDNLPGPFTGTVGLDLGSETSLRMARASALAAQAHMVLERAGLSGVPISFKAFTAAARGLFDLQTLLTQPSRITPLEITTSTVEDFDLGEVVQLHCCHPLRIGDHLIAYTVLAEMIGTLTGDRIVWRSRALKMVDISGLKPTRQAFDDYTKSFIESSSVTSYYIAPFLDEATERLGKPRRSGRKRGGRQGPRGKG